MDHTKGMQYGRIYQLRESGGDFEERKEAKIEINSSGCKLPNDDNCEGNMTRSAQGVTRERIHSAL